MKQEYGGTGFFVLHNLYFPDLILNKGKQSKMSNADLSNDNMQQRFADPTAKSESKIKLKLRDNGGGIAEDTVRMLKEVAILGFVGGVSLRTETKCLCHRVLHSSIRLISYR